MGTCMISLASSIGFEIELQYPSTEVAKHFPRGKTFTPQELLKTMSESINMCQERIEQSKGKGVADYLMGLEIQINKKSTAIVKTSVFDPDEIYTVSQIETDICAFNQTEDPKKD